MQDEYATIIQDNEYDPESAEQSEEEESDSQQSMRVSVVKPNPKLEKIGNPKMTIGLSPIRRSIHVNDIGLDDTNQHEMDFQQ